MTDTQHQLSRRTFLKGGLALTLGFSRFASADAAAVARQLMHGVEYKSSEDLYRKKWVWDKVAYGSHSNACSPAGCLWHVYSRNGIVWREEQAAKHPFKNAKYPDFNPMGCQKGCGFSQVLHGSERIKYPLKRAGKRGEGKWERITWDQALGDIDAVLAAAQRSKELAKELGK